MLTRLQVTGSGFIYIIISLYLLTPTMYLKDFPGGSDGKVSVYNAGDLGSIPGSGGSPGEGNGSPLQYSCLENPMDTGAWWATVHGVAKSRTRLSDCTTCILIVTANQKCFIKVSK